MRIVAGTIPAVWGLPSGITALFGALIGAASGLITARASVRMSAKSEAKQSHRDERKEVYDQAIDIVDAVSSVLLLHAHLKRNFGDEDRARLELEVESRLTGGRKYLEQELYWSLGKARNVQTRLTVYGSAQVAVSLQAFIAEIQSIVSDADRIYSDDIPLVVRERSAAVFDAIRNDLRPK